MRRQYLYLVVVNVPVESADFFFLDSQVICRCGYKSTLMTLSSGRDDALLGNFIILVPRVRTERIISGSGEDRPEFV